MNTCSGKMLVVDDEDAIRTTCARILAGMGISVETANSGAAAWSLLNKQEFDCVLTDISMPGSMDGTALTEEVRSRFPSTDMLIMTGDPQLATAVSTLKHGALDYLIKPFGATTLEAAVTRCFERRRLSGELNQEKHLRRELAAAYAELQKTERAKDAFISVLNHELRTPLSIAIAATEVLEGAGPVQTKTILTMLRSSLARENEVVNDLLLFSKIAAGTLTLNCVQVDVDAMIRALVENYRSIWLQKRVELDLRFETTPIIWGDPALLKTAFKHLLLNAIHFNTTGGKVRIEARNTQEHLELVFADTGIGIAPELQASIFDRFYQVAEHMTRKVGGLGLGLAIVRRIVEAHGGYVSVSDHEGGGTEFHVKLRKDLRAPDRLRVSPSHAPKRLNQTDV